MRERKSIFANADWTLIILYLALVLIGWINIYSAVYSEESGNFFDLNMNHGRQLIWIGSSLLIAIVVLAIDAKFYNAFSFPIYLLSVFLLIAVLILGKEVAGARSWFQIGPFAFQPSEFAKVATSLALARYLSVLDVTIKDAKSKIYTSIIIGVPMVLIYLQNDTGSALVYFSFLVVMFREGLSGKIMITLGIIILLFVLTLMVNKYILSGILGLIAILTVLMFKLKRKRIFMVAGLLILSIGFIFSVEYGFNNLLEPHQRSRIHVLLGQEIDLQGAGYNVHQSKIAIGSGGFSGKGFLKGTQTKFDFVPEQSTDFIFCTVGEEWGFIGSFVVIGLYLWLLIRIILRAEKQRSLFSRIYGYCVASILFFHFAINIGMTIGLTPVIGIPLPFLSYGGSSLWAFTILLFIFIRLDTKYLELI